MPLKFSDQQLAIPLASILTLVLFSVSASAQTIARPVSSRSSVTMASVIELTALSQLSDEGSPSDKASEKSADANKGNKQYEVPAAPDDKADSSDANESTEKESRDKDKDADDESKLEDSKSEKKKDSDSRTLLLNRNLSSQVNVASIAVDKIGTGVVPTAKNSMPSAVQPLSRAAMHTHVYWRASGIQHFPLYFEDAMLERHGQTRCVLGSELGQSLVSGAKFFTTIPLLPYLETLRPKHDCVYALGHYRPGSTAPCLKSALPYDQRAAVVQSASVAAFFWAMPL